MLGTVLAGAKRPQPEVAFAEPLEGAPGARTVFDRFGLWVVVALVLVAIAYAYPLASHLGMDTFGSPGFRQY